VEAGELQDWLVYFHCLSVNLLGEGVDRQPPGEKDFASSGDGLHHAVTKTVGDSSQLQPIKTVIKPSLL
jgi:hypothetical protein